MQLDLTLLYRYVLVGLLLSLAGCATQPPSTSSDVTEPVSALDQVYVTYAGLALAGTAQTLTEQYPHLSQLQHQVQGQMREGIRTINPAYYQLNLDQLVDRRRGYSVSMAMVIDDENTVIEQVNGLYKVVIEISAKAVVFDFDEEEKAIIAVYQLPIDSYVDVFEQPPTQAQLASMFQLRAYQAGDSVVTRFLSMIEGINIKQKYAQEIGMGQVSFADKALPLLPDNWLNAQGQDASADIKFALANRFAGFLSANQRVSVIPTVDNSLGVMALRFTGESLDTLLTLPEVDYTLDIHVRGFRKVTGQQNQVGRADLYASGIEVRLSHNQPGGPSVIFDQRLKSGVWKKVLQNQQLDSDWSYFEEALYLLFQQTSEGITTSRTQWHTNQQFDAQAKQQLAQFAEVLALCR